jgi:hypothetical protein
VALAEGLVELEEVALAEGVAELEGASWDLLDDVWPS